MKTVLFFRHGKSDWDADWELDFDRPLAKRGRKAAKKMGRWLAETGPLPDHIVCSSARRARQTLKRARKSGDWQARVAHTRDLYHAYPSDLLEAIRHAPDDVAVLMLVGHEPTWSETIERLTGKDVAHFPTAAMARVDLDAEAWKDAAFGRGRLVWLQKPREL